MAKKTDSKKTLRLKVAGRTMVARLLRGWAYLSPQQHKRLAKADAPAPGLRSYTLPDGGLAFEVA